MLKSVPERDAMRKAGRVVGKLLKRIRDRVKPGVTTAELDAFSESFIAAEGAKPAFKGYCGYPATIYASVNEEVVHGIPSKRSLEAGDIIGIDVGAIVDGFYADAARTFAVGEVSEVKDKLIRAARESLAAGILKATAGNRVSDISNAVQSVIEKFGFGIVRQYVGHGIGKNLHEEPQVPNFGPPNEGPLIRPGMALAIEPMVNAGTHEVVLDKDGWTVRTLDGQPSSHMEQTVLVTENGTEVLTLDAD